jgi:hypothetical protein
MTVEPANYQQITSFNFFSSKFWKTIIQHNDKLIMRNLIYVSQNLAGQFKMQLPTRYYPCGLLGKLFTQDFEGQKHYSSMAKFTDHRGYWKRSSLSKE